MILSIVIPVHNRFLVTKLGIKRLIDALSSFNKSNLESNLNIRIVVVDDGSVDGTSEYLSNYYKEILLLKGNGNLWWSGSINLGVKYSIETLNATHILLWNDDTYPEESFFKNLCNVISADDNALKIMGSLILDSETEQIWSAGGIYNTTSGRKYMLKSINHNASSCYEVDWLPGMGTLIPVSVINEIGLWDDKNFPQYHGDIDFTLRAKNAGYKIFVSSDLTIYNQTEHSSIQAEGFIDAFRNLSKLNNRYNLKKNILFYRRHTKTPFWILIMIKNYAKYFFKALKASND